MRLAARIAALIAGLLALAPASADPPERKRPLAIHASRILTMGKAGTIHDGVALFVDGKVKAVGRWGKLPLPPSTQIVEAGDAWLTPGLIELHCHVGAGAGYGDLNDSIHQVNAELRNLDGYAPGNAIIRRSLTGGVTTALFIPGSGSNISGFGTLVKFTSGPGAVLRFPGAMKIAQAYNPERGRDFGAGRMGMNLMIRRALVEGREYAKAWKRHAEGKGPEPEKQPRLEYLRTLFERRAPVIVHTAGMQVLHSTTRILHYELGLRPIVSHGTFDGFRDAPHAAKAKLHLNIGPRQIYFDRRARTVYGIAERWWNGGVRDLSVCTDSPVLPQEDLFYQGTLSGYFGGPPSKNVLEGLTIGAAKALFIEDRIGSLDGGKDADAVLWTGDPLDPRSRVLKVWIDGRRVYDLRRDKGRY